MEPAPTLTLYSNSLMGKYVLVRSYDISKSVPHNFEYLYDHNLPTYDYIQKENRKKIKVMSLSTGHHEVQYEDHQIYIDVEIPFLKNPLIDKHHSDIIYKITLRLAGCPPPEDAKTVLINYVNHCKTYVEELMENNCKDAGKTIKKYIYDASADGGHWTILNISNKRPVDSIFLPQDEKKSFLQKIKYFVSDTALEEYARFNVPYKLNVLFHGLPGTGKTSCIHAVASEISSDIGIIHFNKLIDDTMLTKAINQMSNLEKCRVLVFEDIDSLFSDERKAYDNAKNAITLSGLLNCLDGLSRNEGIIVFMTTNRREVLDDIALTRCCRVDIEMEFKDATEDQIETMIRYYFPSHVKDVQDKTIKSVVETLKNKNCTTSVLQQYFFEQRHCNNILELPKLKDYWDNYRNKSNPDKNKSKTLYT
jgi:predicted AAA+ superfamily ATPase